DEPAVPLPLEDPGPQPSAPASAHAAVTFRQNEGGFIISSVSGPGGGLHAIRRGSGDLVYRLNETGRPGKHDPRRRSCFDAAMPSCDRGRVFDNLTRVWRFAAAVAVLTIAALAGCGGSGEVCSGG